VTLPAPNLDDRRFQELVDDAKRMVQKRCPEWTDHNVHDPGVTLIETFAFMVDQLIYRLNRVPDRLYVKFLELLGVRLFPPTAARASITFWLSAPREDVLRVPAATEVSTPRGSSADSVVTFSTSGDLEIIPCSLYRLMSTIDESVYRDHIDRLDMGGFHCFDTPPKPGDALLVGVPNPVPSCAVALRFQCEIEGVGVDPTYPPLVWEAFCRDQWVGCELDHDETGGLNRAGEVVLHVPPGHTASIISRERAGWLRCRVVAPEEGQPFYSSSPRIQSLQVSTIGGTVEAGHALEIRNEVMGVSEGVPGQRFRLAHSPAVPGDDAFTVETGSDGSLATWEVVESFGESGPDDRHVTLDATTGEIVFGPAVRLGDGTVEYHGAVPEKDSVVRAPAYRTGGGSAGNVARGALSILKSSLPYISRVENRQPASGGVDGETVEEAKVRGPITLRTRGRAVTREDYEQLAREAAPEVARVRCIESSPDPSGAEAEPGGVRVLVVPAAADGESGELRIEQLIPSEESLSRIRDYLDERRTVGARVVVEPPTYLGVTVVTRLRAKAGVRASRLQAAAVEALNRYLHPISGGPEGGGWPFGRPVLAGEVYSVLQSLRGTELVEDVRLFAAGVIDGTRGPATNRIDLDSNALVLSYGHQVLVEGS
jgi:predicted phage baseplate assembly protein